MPSPSCSCSACGGAPAGAAVSESPVGMENEPGRARLRFRAGVHGSFKEAMLEKASRSEGLRGHTARDDSSAAVALLDACAVMLDVVTFYAERVMNEGNLATAAEHRSVLELARTIGYELKPGVAAATRLAFEVQTAPGMPDTVAVPVGTQVQSMPADGELPQTFETVEEMEARPGWNAFPPKRTRPQRLAAGQQILTLAGTGLGLRVGGRLVLQFGPAGSAAGHRAATVADLAEDFDRKVTLVTLSRPLSAPVPQPEPGYPRVIAFGARAGVFGAAAPDWKSLPAASKREILGLDEGAEIPEEDRLEWPGYVIHLPGATRSRFEELAGLETIGRNRELTAETISQRVRNNVRGFADAAEAVLRTQASSAGFAAAGAGLRSLDVVGGAVRAAGRGLAVAAEEMFGAVADSPQVVADQVVRLFGVLGDGLRELLTVGVALENRMDVSLLELGHVYDRLLESLKTLELRAGSPESFTTPEFREALAGFATELVRSSPLQFIDRLAGRVRDELESGAWPERAHDGAEALLAALAEFRGLSQAALRVGLARQAQAVVDNALAVAGALGTPSAFRTRRGFMTFVAVTLGKTLALPGRLGPGSLGLQQLLAAPSDPGVLEHELDPESYENFDPQLFTIEDGAAVSDSELALAAFVIGSDPRIAVSYAALAALFQGERMAGETRVADLLPAGLGEGPATVSVIEQTSRELQQTVLSALTPPPLEAGVVPAFALDAPGSRPYRTATVSLNQEYEDMLPGSLVYLDDPAGSALLVVSAVETVSRSGFGISGKSTVLTADPAALAPFRESVRTLVVDAVSRAHALAEEIDPEPVEGGLLQVDGAVPELSPGKKVSIEGADAGTGALSAELAEVHAVSYLTEEKAWEIRLAAPLTGRYLRATALMRGNLVLATHGAAASQVLGHGDAGAAFQTFPLSGSPLTHVSSASEPGGRAAALTVRVEDRAWRRVDSLFGAGPLDEVYTLRLQDDGVAQIGFGDGRTGARPPSGINNVRAEYRTGHGAAGNLPAGRLILLASRPLGLTGVAQPLPASGGEGAEELAGARENAPLTVRTLDRLVALRDYEAYAAAFGGIAKAQASWAWIGEAQGVLVTVAGADGAAVPAGSELEANLLGSMKRYRDPAVPVRLASYLPLRFVVEARLAVDPALEAGAVLESARSLLLDRFSFASARLGGAVSASDLVAALHGIAGVEGVDLDRFHRADRPPALRSRLEARSGTIDGSGTVRPAQLLTLDPARLALSLLQDP